ncbi:MAG: sigma-54-dependent Fis family transcriptional regulator, partial [Lentisphaeria bacterium]|nr:sigma-54-dependent Fis family transcriptional regulator [Lentisphaeria bacterium]
MSAGAGRERILVVDDAPDTLEVLQRSLAAQGYATWGAADALQATEFLRTTPVDLVVTDLKMPGASGIDLVRHIRSNCKHTRVMIVTGYATVESAVEAMKKGAEEYLAKPFTEEELLAAVRRVLDRRRQQRLMGRPAERPGTADCGLIGESPALQRVRAVIAKAAATTATVLVTGESGSGKELVARAIHYRGARAAAPFVPINCGGIPEALLESELFGYVKGAFTGAYESRAGFFQTADGGTIFLDEISETSLAMQVKLLRVLQDRSVYMVGDSKPRRVDVRIVAATNKDIEHLVSNHAFREDLFYRINVIRIHVPPLRERGDDVLLLMRHFAARFAAELGKPPVTFTDRALNVFSKHSWPGNVRELENVVQRLVVMAEEPRIDLPDLPDPMRFCVQHEGRTQRSLADVEREHVRNVLASVNGNRSRAAEILGIDR